MNTEVRKFQEDAARHLGKRTGTAVRYSSDLRRRAVAWARRRHGVPVAAAARELGVRPRTLRLWLREPRRRPRLRRVDVDGGAPALHAPTRRAVLVTPHGVRIEGLEVTDLVTLLRAL